SAPPVTRRTDAAEAIGVDALVVPVHRLSVRGVAPSLVQRELTAVLAELFPRRAVRLEEVDATGAVTRLDGAADVPSEAIEGAECGDGAGRRLRLGVQGPLADSARAALGILAQVTSQALEIASLRGFAAPRAAVPDDEGPELPGFIAASPAMRRLRGELARL